MRGSQGLIFLYNSKSGFNSALTDYLHKILSPSTYKCKLCSLTYNNFGKIHKWKRFIKSINLPVIFKYADHVTDLGMDIQTELPAIFNINGSLFVSANEINSCITLDDLIDLIQSRLIENYDK